MKYLLAFFFLYSFFGFSQDFDTMNYSIIFEDLTRQTIRIADIPLKYHGVSPTYITRVEQSPELSHRIDKKVFYKDSTVTVRVLVRPKKLGNFNYKLRIYLENQKEPVRISVRGFVSELPEITSNWEGVVPSFEKKTKRIPDSVAIRFIVKDALSKKILNNSDVAIIRNGIPISSWRTGSNGMVSDTVETGFYYFFTQRNGYNTLETGIQITPTIKEIEIPLFPDTAKCEVYAKTTVIENADLIENQSKIELQLEKEEQLDPLNYKPLNIIFLLDLSQSILQKDRLPLMKYALQQSIQLLRASDNVTFLGYRDKAEVLQSTISGDQKPFMRQTIGELNAFGLSYAEAGLKLALQKFNGKLDANSTNTLVLITDGAFNGKNKRYKRLINKLVANNVQISVVGLKIGKENEDRLREAAQLGNGEYLSLTKIAEGQNQLTELFKRQSFRGRKN